MAISTLRVSTLRACTTMPNKMSHVGMSVARSLMAAVPGPKTGNVMVEDHELLMSEVLPRFFKQSTTMTSFLRQVKHTTIIVWWYRIQL